MKEYASLQMESEGRIRELERTLEVFFLIMHAFIIILKRKPPLELLILLVCNCNELIKFYLKQNLDFAWQSNELPE